MPTVAIFTSRGGLGDCAQHAAVHALSDPSLTLRLFARETDFIGKNDDWGKGGKPEFSEAVTAQLHEHLQVVPYATETPEAAEELKQALEGVDAIVAAPASRQGGMERLAAPSMRVICAAAEAAGVRRLVYLSTVGVDSPPMPWTIVGKLFGLYLATAMRKGLKDFRAADAAVRGSGLKWLIVRTMGLDQKCQPRGEWKTLPPDDKGPLQLNISKGDVGQFMLQQATLADGLEGDLQMGYEVESKKKGN